MIEVLPIARRLLPVRFFSFPLPSLACRGLVRRALVLDTEVEIFPI